MNWSPPSAPRWREVLAADLILHVRDISHPETEEQAGDVGEIPDSLGVEDDVPLVEVWNKIDASPETRRALRRTDARTEGVRAISALTARAGRPDGCGGCCGWPRRWMSRGPRPNWCCPTPMAQAGMVASAGRRSGRRRRASDGVCGCAGPSGKGAVQGGCSVGAEVRAGAHAAPLRLDIWMKRRAVPFRGGPVFPGPGGQGRQFDAQGGLAPGRETVAAARVPKRERRRDSLRREASRPSRLRNAHA